MNTKNIEATTSPTTRLIVARRARIGIRISLIIGIAAVFHIYTGAAVAACWAALCLVLIGTEFVVFREVNPATVLSRAGEWVFHGNLLLSTIVFTSLGFLQSIHGDSWGVVCAAIMWSGMIASAAVISGQSYSALACSLLPPLLAFFAIPFLVYDNGGTFGESLTVAIAGLINAGSTVVVWAQHQRLLTEASEARESNRLALIDTETGLPSRTALLRRVEELKNSNTTGLVVMAAISINRFEHLRGAIGHVLTLDLIRRLAVRLQRAYSDAPIARLSSADIGITYIAADMEEALRIATRLQSVVAEPMLLRDNRVDVGVTIGLCTPNATASATNLSIIDRALIAVDQARAARKHVARFNPQIYGDPGSTLSLMSDMLRALENGQMSLVYQPKLDLCNRSIRHVEALVRWHHPARGDQRPDVFVQMAEQTGHIAALTEWVLRHAVEDQSRLYAVGHEVCVSVNWSGLLIDDSGFTDTALAITSHAAGPICLEVTETAIIGNASLARQTLERFRAAGLTISIDDYGSGLSSLAYLKNIPADELKIDQAFVLNMASDAVDSVLVQSVVSLAHSLGLAVVAEGVEDAAALDLLTAMGCDFAQGYLIARPMPLSELMLFLREYKMARRPNTMTE